MLGSEPQAGQLDVTTEHGVQPGLWRVAPQPASCPWVVPCRRTLASDRKYGLSHFLRLLNEQGAERKTMADEARRQK